MNVFVNIMPRFETFINNCFVKAFINLSAGKKSKVERPMEGGGKLNIIKDRIIYCSHAAAKTHFSKTFKDRASLMHSNLILGIRTTIPCMDKCKVWVWNKLLQLFVLLFLDLVVVHFPC